MEEDGFHWTGFRDLASVSEAALAFVRLYGVEAIPAVKECVATATADGRDEDGRFWFEVVDRLNALQQLTGTGSERQS